MSHRRVDGRGRYGKEYGNTLVQRRICKEGRRAVSPRGLQSLQKRMGKCHRNLPNPHLFKPLFGTRAYSGVHGSAERPLSDSAGAQPSSQYHDIFKR